MLPIRVNGSKQVLQGRVALFGNYFQAFPEPIFNIDAGPAVAACDTLDPSRQPGPTGVARPRRAFRRRG